MTTNAKGKSAIVELKALLEDDEDRLRTLFQELFQELLEQEMTWALAAATSEHTNGLVRQYFPKGTDFRVVTESQIRTVEDRINYLPRKVLGYRTPAEVFTGALVPP